MQTYTQSLACIITTGCLKKERKKKWQCTKKSSRKKPDILENYLKLNIKFNLDIKNELKKCMKRRK